MHEHDSTSQVESLINPSGLGQSANHDNQASRSSLICIVLKIKLEKQMHLGTIHTCQVDGNIPKIILPIVFFYIFLHIRCKVLHTYGADEQKS